MNDNMQVMKTVILGCGEDWLQTHTLQPTK